MSDRAKEVAGVEHFPEKWIPVFRKEMRQTANLERFPVTVPAHDVFRRGSVESTALFTKARRRKSRGSPHDQFERWRHCNA